MRPSQLRDVFDIASRLRAGDRDEIAAGTGHEPVEVLKRGLACSVPCLTVQKRGRAEAMFGVVPLPSRGSIRIGSIWLLGTDEIGTFSRPFARESVVWLERVSAQYDMLHNHIDARQVGHMRWLSWLGFQLLAPVPSPVSGLPFHPFVRLSHV